MYLCISQIEDVQKGNIDIRNVHYKVRLRAKFLVPILTLVFLKILIPHKKT